MGEILKYLKSYRFLVALAPRNDKIEALTPALVREETT